MITLQSSLAIENTTWSRGYRGREVTVSLKAIKKLSEGAEKETFPIRLQS